MKIQSAGNVIERYGDMDAPTAFTIKANRQAFQILSSQLYSNKPLAVVREYVCNALDAHVAAGCPQVPIEVHLPTSMEPYFSVKDFGTGLSHENVLHLYTTYFESSKSNSNDQIGGLGLGSKSFFAYTDSFSITSRFNGMKRAYTSFINEEGMPDIVLMSEEETTEPNGLEVSGAVKSHDFAIFHSNVREFLARVEPKPIVTGVSNFAINTLSYNHIGINNWKVRTKNDGQATAVMGCVAYPIDIEDARLNKVQLAVRRLPIDINFNIGEIDIAASREKLSFIPASVAAVKAKFDVIADEVSNDFVQKFSSCRNLWEAKCLYLQLTVGDYAKFRPLLDGVAIEWKGQKLNGNKFQLTNVPLAQVSQFYYNYTRSARYQRATIREIEPNSKIKMYINDLPIGAISRCRYAVKETGEDVCLVNLNGTPLADFLAEIGREGDTLPVTSSLPKPPRAAGSVTEKGKAQVLELQLDGIVSDAAQCWGLPEEGFDMEEGGLYVSLERYSVGGMSPKEYYNRYIATVGGVVDLSAVQIYGVKAKSYAKFQNHPKWVAFSDFVSEEVKTRVNDPKVVQKFADYRELMKLRDDAFLEHFMEFAQPRNPNSAIIEFKTKLDLVEQNVKDIKDVDALNSLASRYNVQLVTVPPSFDLTREFEETLAKYPMLGPVRYSMTEARWYCEDMLDKHGKVISDYINQVDDAAAQV